MDDLLALDSDQETEFSADEVLKAWVDDYRSFSQDCIFIKDHNTATIVPFRFNHGQEILHTVAEKQKAELGYVRILLLKSRRFGGSTYVEGRFYWKTSLNFNRNTFIIGHEKESTNTLFSMAKLFQERNPAPPQIKKSNEKVLLFDTSDGKGLKSEYRLATAENVDAGRSQGVHYLHGSEEAFWRDGATLLTGIMQCVPDPPAESEVFRESTANGHGNSFQEDVSSAYAEGRYPYHEEGGRTYAWSHPDTDWVLVFVPWFDIERYVRTFKSLEERQRFAAKINEPVFDEADMRWVESEALKLKKRYDLSLEQLNWREWAIENKCRGRIDTFHQEYPSTVEEAFLSQGSNVFGQELCDELEEQCEAPLIVGDVVRRGGKSRIRPNRHGKFSLWVKPDDKETYFITVDAGGGQKERHRQMNITPDPTCIDVYNHRTGVQVAQWQGQIEYDLIADMVEMIGDMFFRCKACPELNNHGYTVVANLKKADYPMFEWKPGEPGWSTNKKTKPVMVDDLYQMARDGGIQLRSKATVSEMRTFVEENGSYNAATGCKDDRVDTAAMATQMLKMLPKEFEVKRGDKKPFKGFSNWDKRVKKPESDYREVYI